jgi:CobQ-like glutamine amidotransferase family enzyme
MKEQDKKDKEEKGIIKSPEAEDMQQNLASQIEKNKKAAIREKIVETTLDKL